VYEGGRRRHVLSDNRGKFKMETGLKQVRENIFLGK